MATPAAVRLTNYQTAIPHMRLIGAGRILYRSLFGRGPAKLLTAVLPRLLVCLLLFYAFNSRHADIYRFPVPHFRTGRATPCLQRGGAAAPTGMPLPTAQCWCHVSADDQHAIIACRASAMRDDGKCCLHDAPAVVYAWRLQNLMWGRLGRMWGCAAYTHYYLSLTTNTNIAATGVDGVASIPTSPGFHAAGPILEPPTT